MIQYQNQVVQYDYGGEFRPFAKLLNDQGIIHTLTCPHTLHQNGSVERKHGKIIEMGLTILAHASIPIKVWDHSFTTAVFLINRLPTSALSNFDSPYMALHNKQPDYTLLKVFGSSCFPHVRSYNKNNLKFISLKCTYIGVSPTHNDHKCISPKSKIYVSKDVVFNETKFPWKTRNSLLNLNIVQF